MKYETHVFMILGAFLGLYFGMTAVYALVLWFVGGLLLKLLALYFFMPLLYCKECESFHVFGVNNHPNEHSLGK